MYLHSLREVLWLRGFSCYGVTSGYIMGDSSVRFLCSVNHIYHLMNCWLIHLRKERSERRIPMDICYSSRIPVGQGIECLSKKWDALTQ